MSKSDKNEGRLIAQARDEFFKKNQKLLDPGAHREYLKNRLEVAFIAGWEACKKVKQ